jgi:hypothetical protein
LEFSSATLSGTQQRNPAEAYVAARAAACPDLFVIHAPEQTARERVIADVVAATPTERVLILSTDGLTTDRIVERLVKLEIRAIRALADDENPIRPLPLVAKSTSAAIVAARLEQLKTDAAQALASAQDRLAAVVTRMERQAKLLDLCRLQAAIGGEIASVNAQHERLSRQVELEAAGVEVTAFTARVEHSRAERQNAIEVIQDRQRTAQASHREKEALVAELRKQASEATTEAGKKTSFFSRLLGKPKHGHDPLELSKQLLDAESELNEIAATLLNLQCDISASSAKLQEDREQLIQAELAIRQTECTAQLAHWTKESRRLEAEIEALTEALGSKPLAHEECESARESAEREVGLARQHIIELDRTAREIGKRILGECRVVVGMPGSLSADPVFELASQELSTEPPFGLLVLDRAEELTEPDFIHLAKLATRWVLVGDVLVSDDSRPRTKAPPPRHGLGFARNGRASELPFTTRLALTLDREKWAYEAGWLVCRLEHVTPEARRGMTREPLLDRPEIELRFSSTSDGEPVLVEVAFPQATSIAAAKAFLYRQLNEVLLRPFGPVAWQSTPTTISACWSMAEHSSSASSEASWIDLETGVREKVVGMGLASFTAALAFDVAAGWDFEKAELWLKEHFSSESLSRFATVPRR